jgi:radical SAM superfamily enzyme YgiQ (UPF0313 family)
MDTALLNALDCVNPKFPEIEEFDKVITEPEGLPFLDLPAPDRVFTRAMDKKYIYNGNYKYTPGTHIQSAKGCWWGKCTFCVENKGSSLIGKTKSSSLNGSSNLLSPYLVRPVDSVIEEIKECKRLNFRELFDDSATFPQGGWLDEFISKFSKCRGQMRFSCNWRLKDFDYSLLYASGFRMLLFGIESANQKTLDRINKGVKCEDVKYVKKAAEAGLEPHGAFMFGYPWEDDSDSIRTLKLAHYLLKKGFLKTAQASFYTPQKDGKGNESQRKYVKKIYGIWKSPSFWLTKIRDIKNRDDLKYLWRAIKKGLHDSSL